MLRNDVRAYQTAYLPMWYRWITEPEVFGIVSRIHDELPDKERRILDKSVARLQAAEIRGLGRLGILELLARLGDFVNQMENSRG